MAKQKEREKEKRIYFNKTAAIIDNIINTDEIEAVEGAKPPGAVVAIKLYWLNEDSAEANSLSNSSKLKSFKLTPLAAYTLTANKPNNIINNWIRIFY